MNMVKYIMIMCLISLSLLHANITVLPTQGSVGETFHFKVSLNNQQAQNTDNVYVRIYSEDSQSYDYKMNLEKEGIFTLSVALYEENTKKEFIYGIQDFHGQIHWHGEKHSVCIIDNSDVDELMEDCATRALQNAINNVDKKSGETNWNGEKHHGRWVTSNATFCARFVRMCLGEPLKFSSAKGMYRHFKRQGVIKTKGIAPMGAVLFYATRSGYGHTGIADGEGGLFSASSYIRGVRHEPTFSDRGRYLGYVEAAFFKGYY